VKTKKNRNVTHELSSTTSACEMEPESRIMIDDEAKMARQTPVAMAPTTSQQRCVQRWLLSVYLSISIRSIDENS